MNQRTQFHPSLPNLLSRGVLGGILMGLANLVPGISGGTMLLAVGIYPFFIDSVAEITTFRFRVRSLLLIASVAVAAACGILLLAGPIKNLVVEHRWIMYSLFIGLTLGGVPIIVAMIGKFSRTIWIAALFGFIAMGIVAWLQQIGAGTAGNNEGNWIMLLVAGIAGASAMILPGISGGYLLLVLGQYIPILSAIDTFKGALQSVDTGLIINVGLTVILPVGIGIIAGIAGVSNLLRYLLRKHRQATLGVLLGILLGAVIGLWPFQEGRKPDVGETFRGERVTEETIETIEPDDYPTAFFKPTGLQIVASVGLAATGFAATYAISRLNTDTTKGR